MTRSNTFLLTGGFALAAFAYAASYVYHAVFTEEEKQSDNDNLEHLVHVTVLPCQLNYLRRVTHHRKNVLLEVPFAHICQMIENGASFAELEPLLKADLEILIITDRFGRTLLHYTCSRHLFTLSVTQQTLKIVSYMINLNPNALDETDIYENTPLHLACCSSASLPLIQLLANSFPPAVKSFNFLLQSPLHAAYSFELTEYEIIHYLFNLWPLSCLFMASSYGWVTRWHRAAMRKCDMTVSLFIQMSVSDTHIASSPSQRERRAPIVKFMADMIDCVEQAFIDMIFSCGGYKSSLISQEDLELMFNNERMRRLLPFHLRRLMSAFAQMHKAGRIKAVKGKAATVQGLAILVSVTNYLDCLYTHLRENPFFLVG